MAVDWSDPCARFAALQAAYYSMLSASEGGETLIRARGPEGEQEVRFGKPDLDRLHREMLAAQNECAIKNGLPANGRYAIRAGAPRRCL